MSLNTTNSWSMKDYLNLLTMTAIIKSTSTVMIAIVTILFVAILVTRQHKSFAYITTDLVNTFAPCLSASCYFCPCSPRSQVEYLLCAQWSPAELRGLKVCCDQYPPSRAQCADSPLTCHCSSPTCPCRSKAAASAPAGHLSRGHLCTACRTAWTCRFVGSSA